MQAVIQPDVNIIDFGTLKPLPDQDSCITIGNFDGVHLGHQAIITQMVREAEIKNRPVIVVTFFPNPYAFFKAPGEAYYLSTPSEKEQHLLTLGVDRVITFRFNQEFANLTAEAFIAELKKKLGLGVLVVGEDFALGKNRQGTIPVLTELGRRFAFSVETISQVKASDREISSTMIRSVLDEGAVAQAAELLGRPYQVAGLVTHGSDRGSKIGLPTANLDFWPQKKLPAVGVYATLVYLRDQVHQGITNIGYRPTFENQHQVDIETHILDFDGNIYGEKISLALIQKLRDEQKFPGVDAFLAQIERDKAQARRIFKHVET
jgi:riboflavin kinase / FMN adenylyltransferase